MTVHVACLLVLPVHDLKYPSLPLRKVAHETLRAMKTFQTRTRAYPANTYMRAYTIHIHARILRTQSRAYTVHTHTYAYYTVHTHTYAYYTVHTHTYAYYTIHTQSRAYTTNTHARAREHGTHTSTQRH